MTQLADSSIHIRLSDQKLFLLQQGVIEHEYIVSTSKYGVGCLAGSYKTPLGQHMIRAKIGADHPVGSVFIARRPTGEIYSSTLADQEPQRDWVLSRILWLSGLEVGRNRLGNVDTMRRYIYIHGTPEVDKLGTPASIGCIRMGNEDVIDLFSRVSLGCRVDIFE